MFQLLRVYTRLCNALCIKLPAADPCLFISRYAQRLQLGDKSDVICVTAMRLVSRMKRDWMATGMSTKMGLEMLNQLVFVPIRTQLFSK